jgi:hypothetical protein
MYPAVQKAEVISMTTRSPIGPIVGKTSELNVIDDAKTVRIAVLWGNLTTGIGLRDKHMRETYLETPSFRPRSWKSNGPPCKYRRPEPR